ncbi:hypothetical protein ACFZAR_31545 [Streptomyces sp. NPDC008222]|uniref:hypothetical protein n=1 Tax=Streptomyces sp. NPDC008222 TaxID=3364820 RepID=UPI0036E90111
MSAVTAWAAAPSEFIDNPIDGLQRRRLRSVTTQAGLVPVSGPAHPLALGRDARARLGGAVRALLDVPGLDGVSDAVRLAVIVLASRTPSESGVVEIRTPELGRWLGLSASYVASDVVPVLRRSGVVDVATAGGEFGQDVGLECKVLPLWAAHGVVGHPLALAKRELATLLRLLEAVMAPGWVHRDGRVTPAGLLGARTGRAAATDRLALLLLVLEAGETGRVRRCGGTVDTRRGRAAATVARLLGCTASAGERVLGRLEDRDLVVRVRVRTGSGLRHRTRLVVPAVAVAHGRDGIADAREDRLEAAEPEFSDPALAAEGGEAPESAKDLQVSGVLVADEAGVADPALAAALHAVHPPVGTSVSSLSLSGGFSGEGRGGEGRRPERACMRGDQVVNGEPTSDAIKSPVAEARPLRGEMPKESPVDERHGQRGAGAGAGAGAGVRLKAVAGEKTQQHRRLDLPEDLDLRVVLAPVAGLWVRLSGWQQSQIEQAASVELGHLKSLLMQPESAPRLVADRLTDRLMETGGEVLVNSPFGWLTRRGLVQRPACSDVRCDDGMRLDTGGECDNCGNTVHIRRARRARAMAEIDQELPGLGEGERRKVLEDRLREHATAEAEDFVHRREQTRAEQARRDAAHAAAQKRAERERQAAAAAAAVRQALPCEDCGQEQAAGLCETCGYRRRTEALIDEAGLIEASWSAAVNDPAAIAAVTGRVRATVEAETAAARAHLLELMGPAELDADPVAAASAAAFTALQAVQEALPEYRRHALAMLAQTPEAEAEARRAYGAEKRRGQYRHDPNGPIAAVAAGQAAHCARERAAQHLLTTLLKRLNKRPDGLAGDRAAIIPAPRARWADRLAVMAGRSLGDEALESA